MIEEEIEINMMIEEWIKIMINMKIKTEDMEEVITGIKTEKILREKIKEINNQLKEIIDTKKEIEAERKKKKRNKIN